MGPCRTPKERTRRNTPEDNLRSFGISPRQRGTGVFRWSNKGERMGVALRNDTADRELLRHP